MAVEVFKDDDSGYLTWLRHNYLGYVVNAERSLVPSGYYLLHEASCQTISGQPSGGKNWTSAYIKVCSTSIPELRRWVRENARTSLQRCGTCAP